MKYTNHCIFLDTVYHLLAVVELYFFEVKIEKGFLKFILLASYSLFTENTVVELFEST